MDRFLNGFQLGKKVEFYIRANTKANLQVYLKNNMKKNPLKLLKRTIWTT